jgi:hypothetical protein
LYTPHKIVWGHIVFRFVRPSCFILWMQLVWSHWSDSFHIW